jgi:16S rRNA (cytosine1402-N4)-methyltransferase
MMAGPGQDNLAGGGPTRHIPVLLDAVLEATSPHQGMLAVDGTFGAGGYTRALLARGANVIAIDRDPQAISGGRELEKHFRGRLRLVEGKFSRLDEHAGDKADIVVLDIGISSMQVDDAERGFSFRLDGPLDMRMSRKGPSAADVVNRLKVADLARIFGLLGEERHAGRIARMIEKRRVDRPFTRTVELAEAVVSVTGHPAGERIHPATRVFQALRIFVNDELGELARALVAAERVLKPGGRLAVVSFHSLEDRIVKRFLADRSSPPAASRHLPEAPLLAPTFARPARPVFPSEAEIAVNPRARSARLRSAQRTAAPTRADPDPLAILPKLPRLPAAGEEI